MPGMLAKDVIVPGGSADRIEAEGAKVEARDGLRWSFSMRNIQTAESTAKRFMTGRRVPISGDAELS
jgi:hypothetical protein